MADSSILIQIFSTAYSCASFIQSKTFMVFEKGLQIVLHSFSNPRVTDFLKTERAFDMPRFENAAIFSLCWKQLFYAVMV